MKFVILCGIFLLLISCSSTSSEVSNNAEAANYNAQLGLAYLQQGDIDLAKHKLLLALDENPNDPLIIDAMAYFLEQTKNMQMAAQYYLQAIKLAPHMGEVQNNYGAYLCRQGYYQEAISHFLLAVKDPKYLHTGLAYKNAELCALKIPDKALATKYLQQAVANGVDEENSQY